MRGRGLGLWLCRVWKGRKGKVQSLFALTASLALIGPVLGYAGQHPVGFVAGADAPQCQSQGGQTHSNPFANPFETVRHSEPPSAKVPSQWSASNPLEAYYRSSEVNQHRVERRVTIRITPLRQSNRNNLLAPLPRRGVSQKFEERKMDNCVPVSGIAGVQTGNGNRLILFLRDKRIISINLERGCQARDFYSGFYVERSEDGRLCVKRDLLQSRSGAKCEVERMRRLVKADD